MWLCIKNAQMERFFNRQAFKKDVGIGTYIRRSGSLFLKLPRFGEGKRLGIALCQRSTSGPYSNCCQLPNSNSKNHLPPVCFFFSLLLRCGLCAWSSMMACRGSSALAAQWQNLRVNWEIFLTDSDKLLDIDKMR